MKKKSKIHIKPFVSDSIIINVTNSTCGTISATLFGNVKHYDVAIYSTGKKIGVAVKCDGKIIEKKSSSATIDSISDLRKTLGEKYIVNIYIRHSSLNELLLWRKIFYDETIHKGRTNNSSISIAEKAVKLFPKKK